MELSEEAIGRIATVRDLLREVSEAGAGVRAASLLEDPEQVLSAEQKRWLQPHGAMTSAVAAALYALNWVLVRAWFRLRVKGLVHLPEKQPFVLIPNHLSYLDPQVIAAALRFRQLRRTCWGVITTNPFSGLFRRLGQVIPIDPDHALISSLAFGAAVLKRGNHLVWFAEGALSPTGELQPFKPGIGILLEHFQTLAVPVAIHGTDRALPVGKLCPRPKPVMVEFGRPLSPAISSTWAKATGRTNAFSTRSMDTSPFFEVHQPRNRANPATVHGQHPRSKAAAIFFAFTRLIARPAPWQVLPNVSCIAFAVPVSTYE